MTYPEGRACWIKPSVELTWPCAALQPADLFSFCSQSWTGQANRRVGKGRGEAGREAVWGGLGWGERGGWGGMEGGWGGVGWGVGGWVGGWDGVGSSAVGGRVG